MSTRREQTVRRESQQDPDGDHQLVGGDHRATSILRGDFGDVERGGKSGQPHAQPQRGASDDHHGDTRRQCTERGPAQEQSSRHQQGSLASPFVGDEHRENRPESRRQHEGGNNPFRRAVVGLEFLADKPQSPRDDTRVQSEHEAGEACRQSKKECGAADAR